MYITHFLLHGVTIIDDLKVKQGLYSFVVEKVFFFPFLQEVQREELRLSWIQNLFDAIIIVVCIILTSRIWSMMGETVDGEYEKDI
jgi:hypothetical protein